MGENLYRILQSPHAGRNGRTWAIRFHDEAIEIRAGALNGPAPITDTSHDEPSPVRSLWGRMDRYLAQKTREGFISVGYGTFDEADRVQMHKSGGFVPDSLYWSCTSLMEPVVFDELAGEAAAALGRAGQLCVVTRRGLHATTPKGTWAVSRNSDGLIGEPGLGLYEARHGAYTGPGGGRIWATDGVVPTLLLLRIERQQPGTIVFAELGESAQRVTPTVAASDRWLGEAMQPLMDTETVALALGLDARQPMPLLSSHAGAEPTWF